MKKLLLYFLPLISISAGFQKYAIKINDAFLTNDEVKELQLIYKKYHNKELNTEHIKSLLYIYYYLMVFVNSGQIINMADEKPPADLKDHPLAFFITILWNEKSITETYYSIVLTEEDSGPNSDNNNNNKYWQYTLVVGNYRGKEPTIQELKRHFKNILFSNFIPKKSKDNKYYNLVLSTEQLEIPLRPKLIIDKKEKKFSYTVARAHVNLNIKYNLVIFFFNETYSVPKAYEILEENKNIQPDRVVELLNHHNIECKKSTTVLHSSNLDPSINQILETAIIGSYVIIPNSQYIIYIMEKKRCGVNSEKEEGKIQKQKKTALEKLLSYFCFDDTPWRKMESFFYDEKYDEEK